MAGCYCFNNDYLNENIILEELEQELVKTVIPRLFNKMGLKIKRIWHIIYRFILIQIICMFILVLQKINLIIYTNKKLEYRRKGELTQEEISFMKNEGVLAVERKKYLSSMITITNKEIDNLKKYFNPKDKNYYLFFA